MAKPLLPLLSLVVLLAGCGSPSLSPGEVTDSACAGGREASHACQVERYKNMP